jgi:hypothetical protein
VLSIAVESPTAPVRDGGTFVRGLLTVGGQTLEIDIAHEPSEPLAPRDLVEGTVVDSLEDLRANKLTCLRSRSEPRDLVDLSFRLALSVRFKAVALPAP